MQISLRQPMPSNLACADKIIKQRKAVLGDHTTQVCSYPFCKLASTIWCILYLVEKHRIIESEAEPDWMSRLHLFFRDLERFVVCFLRLVNYLCSSTATHTDIAHNTNYQPALWVKTELNF